jgi:hypothetical protein
MSETTGEVLGRMRSWVVKLHRSSDHLNWLKSEFQWFRQSHPYRLGTKYDAKAHQNVFLVESVSPIPLQWGAVIGEIVNGYRSALDHIVYFMAEGRGTATDKTEFPIFVESEKYKLVREQKIGGLDEPAKAVIDLAQPKQRTEGLWLLHELVNLDKHHRIHLTTAVLAGSRLRLGNLLINFPVGVALEPGTVLARFGDADLRALGIDPASVKPEVDMDFQFAFDIAFSDARAATGLRVRQALTKIGEEVARVVERLELELPSERPAT